MYPLNYIEVTAFWIEGIFYVETFPKSISKQLKDFCVLAADESQFGGSR